MNSRSVQRLLCLTILGLLAGSVTFAGPLGVDSGTRERIDRTVDDLHDDLVAFRRDLHRHPELGGEEERTSRMVAERLRALGLEIETGVGGHGVVAILVGGKPGPVVAYRADMDAMAFDAPDPVPFASETPGVRHVCGHDLHTTVGIGIAAALVEIRETIPGSVKFLFQPSEENAAGARAMIAEGALGDPAPVAIFALHCAPLPVGTFGVIEGLALPGMEVVELEVSGEGDREAAAKGCSAVIAGVTTVAFPSSPVFADWITEDPDFAVGVLLGTEENGDTGALELRAMVKAGTSTAYERARAGIRDGIAALGVPEVTCTVSAWDRVIPATVNDPDLVQRTLPVLEAMVGEEGVQEFGGPLPFFSEDFAFFQQKIPGALFFLGVSNEEKGIVGLPHSPAFAADEDAIGVGCKAMARVLLAHLEDR